MDRDNENNSYEGQHDWNRVLGQKRRNIMALMAFLRARNAALLAATLLALMALGSSGAAVAAAPVTYPRLLPLQVSTPAQAQTTQAQTGQARTTQAQTATGQVAKAGKAGSVINVRLTNPGAEAPNARLRVIIHDKDHQHGAGSHELSPDNVKVEVQESGSWKSVLLEMVDGGVMGAIGVEGVAAHRERHKRGGFAIPAGFDKTWPLRVTFAIPGTYSVVVAVSPDNGSRHLAQPAHHIIEVQ